MTAVLTRLDLDVLKLARERFLPKPVKPRRWASPLDMAQELDPTIVRTPALELINRALVDVTDGREDRLIISMPPQEAKSSTVSYRFPTWLLADVDPDMRIIIISYSDDIARRWGADIKRDFETFNGDDGVIDLGVRLRADSRAAGRWQVEGRKGGAFAAGVAGSVSGRPTELMIIDDPIKDLEQAQSSIYRERFQRFWQGVAVPRLGPGARVILVSCMTGDTPVLLPDGTEKPLRDICPGDEVATYVGGGLATSTVTNWANQGPDDLFRIRMKSGRVVRANARHPFLTIDANGNETWLRTAQIQPGASILTATGESGATSPVPPTNATCLHAVKGCATPTTTRRFGHLATDRLRSMLRRVAGLVSNTATDSPMKRSTSSSASRTGTAPFADSRRRTETPGHTGTASCASTTTTTPEKCGDCSATTATSLSDTGSRLRSSGLPLTTWSVTPDEVVAVEPCGREDVFDLQVDRTENFIANGLVSHNTRWHEEDGAGWLIANEGDRAHGGRWRVINIPAISEGHGDALGRPEGVPMQSARGNRDWAGIRKSVGEYVWASLYQGRPAPAEGGLFKRLWWRWWTPAPAQHYGGERLDLAGRNFLLGDCWRFLTGDLAASTRTSADYTVAAAWALTIEGDLVLLDFNRGKVGERDHFDLFRPLAERYAVDTVFLEASQYGTTLVAEASRTGLHITPIQAEVDKFSRALPYSARCSGGRVWLPAGDKLKMSAWVDEHAAFPGSGRHDDTVDVGSIATAVAVRQWAPRTPVPTVPTHRDAGNQMDPFGEGASQIDWMTVAL